MENQHQASERPQRRPPWLRVRAPTGETYHWLKQLMRAKALHTVCEEAHCPNIGECWGHRTATFLILGDTCTRNCRFCNVKTGRPVPLDPDEPERVAQAVQAMHLKHVVITSVDRDDLPDGGASVFAAVIRRIRALRQAHRHEYSRWQGRLLRPFGSAQGRQGKPLQPSCTVEVLIPDFRGRVEPLKTVMDERPDILNHNIETAPRLFRAVQPQCRYEWSLAVLRNAKALWPEAITKSGLMVGLGETVDEVLDVMRDLRELDVDILTIGQYLQPTRQHVPIARYYTPEEFEMFRERGDEMGFRWIESGPLVRSSYNAEAQASALVAGVEELYMPNKLADYRRADAPLPKRHRLWPLYGAGLENMGRAGQPIEVPMPQYGPDELLVRHDACGLCFSDIKVIRLGEEHPRIYRDMQANPVVLGHEVILTVVGVGENLRHQYRVGDRFIIQADIYVGGVNYAYGYEIQGGLSQYNVIDQRVLEGDHGNYLIPVQSGTGYAESALTEPWACVIAAYQLTYRTGLKPGGTTWVIGASTTLSTGASAALSTGNAQPYTISAGFDEDAHPGRLLLTDVPAGFAHWLRARAEALGVEVIEVDDVTAPPPLPSPPSPPKLGGTEGGRGGAKGGVDDIVLLGADPDLIEAVSPHLADFGVLAIIADKPLSRKVNVDVGRVHYNRWVYVGGPGPDVARAYGDVPVRSTLKPGGRAWFVGAGGPMGRMHVQRAIQIADGPSTIVCTDVSDLRLDHLHTTFTAEAEAKRIEFICLNPLNKEEYAAGMAPFKGHSADDIVGFDDIVVLAPVPAVISDAAMYLAPRGVMNIFAGVARGTMARLDLGDVYLKGVRVIGHSASTIDDLRLMLHQAESGTLSPNRSVAALGSLSAARDGLRAVQDAVFPGKIVIYPHIKDFTLTSLPDLKNKLPSVYARLKDGREWTVEAEAEFLRLMLP